MPKGSFGQYLGILSILAILSYCWTAQEPLTLTGQMVSESPKNPIVVRVIDGDTFELDNGSRVRLICINTPETGEFYAEEATDYLASLVLNKEVELEKDVSETDRYGRLLRYVYVNGTFVNRELVGGGYAEVYRFPPDTKYCDEFESVEEEAKTQELGIWS